jgi:hypothetical protein
MMSSVLSQINVSEGPVYVVWGRGQELFHSAVLTAIKETAVAF